MSAARHAHALFVKNKEGNDLKIYCDNSGIPYKVRLFRSLDHPLCSSTMTDIYSIGSLQLFDTFTTVLAEVQAVVAGEKTAEQVMA